MYFSNMFYINIYDITKSYLNHFKICLQRNYLDFEKSESKPPLSKCSI